MEKEYSQDQNEEEVTFKQLILKIQGYWKEFWRNWWLIAIGGIVFAGLFVLKGHFVIPTYSAQVKFIVEGEGGAGGGLSGILGQFGLGNASSGKTNPYKILEVAKSNAIVKSIVTASVEDTLLGNRIITAYNLREEWEKKNSNLKDFFFVDSFSLNTEKERRIFNKMKGLIWGSERDRSKALILINFNDETGIYSIRAKTENEKISIALASIVYEELKQFFEYEVFQNQLDSKVILEVKVDSLEVLRRKKNYELATFQDNNRRLVSSAAEVKKTIIKQDIAAINMAYGEALKNYEFADVSLKSIQPLFLSLQEPVPPLAPSVKSKLRSLIVGGIVGGFLMVIFIFFRKAYRDAMV